MTVTEEQLREYVGAESIDAELKSALAGAKVDVEKYLADNDLVLDEGEEVPAAKIDQAVLAAAADAYVVSQAPNGVVNQPYDDGTGTLVPSPVRISRDPLRSVVPILGQYVLPAVGA